jgi:hypothetical protein
MTWAIMPSIPNVCQLLQIHSMFNVTKYTVIWTMAVAIPFQGLPARSCGCTVSDEAANASTCGHCSSEGTTSCCSARSAGHSCCSDALRQSNTSNCCGKPKCDCDHCTCGIYCPCRHGKQVPPTAPPVEQRSLEKVIGLALAPVSIAVVVPIIESQRSIATLAFCDAMSGADRCVSLCRFTL